MSRIALLILSWIAIPVVSCGDDSAGDDSSSDSDSDSDTDSDTDTDTDTDSDTDTDTDTDSDTDTDTDTDSDTDTDGDVDCSGGWLAPEADLCWQNPSSNTSYAWQEALDYCEGLVEDGYEDWRAPTIDELRSLVRGECAESHSGADGACQVTDGSSWDDWDGEACTTSCAYLGGPGPDGQYWDPELSGPVDNLYWSASTISGAPAQAWDIHFTDGWLLGTDKTSADHFARCVRP
jgi:hypothetical protein